MPNHPIFAPTFHGDVVTVKRLLNDDPNLVAVRDAKNLTPLHVAASRGKTAVALLLIEFGADIHGPTDDGEWTPLVFASYRGHVDVARLLAERGAGVTANDGNPIHFAGQRKHKELCRMLVEFGAIDDLVDSEDEDVLTLFRAAHCFDSPTVQAILSRCPQLVHFKDKNGRTPLHEACTHGDSKTVRVLLRFGADITIQDHNGQMPADRASAHNQHAVTRLLNQHNDTA